MAARLASDRVFPIFHWPCGAHRQAPGCSQGAGARGGLQVFHSFSLEHSAASVAVALVFFNFIVWRNRRAVRAHCRLPVCSAASVFQTVEFNVVFQGVEVFPWLFQQRYVSLRALVPCNLKRNEA